METAKGGQVVPERLAGMAGRQPQPDLIAQLRDATTDLEEAQPQRVQLQARHAVRASQRRSVSSSQ